jgi:hypothetical protein
MRATGRPASRPRVAALRLMPPSSFQSQSLVRVGEHAAAELGGGEERTFGTGGNINPRGGERAAVEEGMTRFSMRNIGCMKPPKLCASPLGPSPGTPW